MYTLSRQQIIILEDAHLDKSSLRMGCSVDARQDTRPQAVSVYAVTAQLKGRILQLETVPMHSEVR